MFAGQLDHSSPDSSLPVHSTSQYLPEYLLGGDSTAGSSSPIHSHHRLWSSNVGDSPKSRTHLSVGPSSMINVSHSNSSLLSPLTMKQGRASINDKHGGPPIQGLFDQNQGSAQLSLSAQSMLHSPANASTANASLGGDGLHKSIFHKSSLNSSLLSPAQLDPFYTQGELLKPDDELDDTWITVFGFPSSAVSYILQEFSLYGNILEHKISGCNNWVHIRYQSKIQAKKALAKNGKIFAGNMMIGVQPCIDKNIMDLSIKENVGTSSPLSFTLPTERSFCRKDETSKMLGIRPLTQAYRAAASDHEVAPNSRMPQKKNSVVTKAMEYVFGW